MWDSQTGFYHDLNENEERLPHKTIAGFWPLLAEIPNADKADTLIAHLSNPETFGTEHPFPTLSVDNEHFRETGEGFCGSVYPEFNFMVIKGLEKYQQFALARECAIRHLYFVLEGLSPADGSKGDLYGAYLPCGEGAALCEGDPSFPKKRDMISIGLSTIALMIENVIGLSISLPRKTVDWVIPNLEIMGIEKLYYFTINIIDQKKKTLPIPSGKCSMLIDKI